MAHPRGDEVMTVALNDPRLVAQSRGFVTGPEAARHPPGSDGCGDDVAQRYQLSSNELSAAVDP
jgi:hypothetical protein